MRTRFFAFAIITFLLLTNTAIKAQYCFWVANQSSETFDELKIRVHGSGNPFGPDLLPYDLIEPGHHFWVRTADNGEEMYDVQIIRQDGTPLLFTYSDARGAGHINQRFITVNARTLHTL